MQKMQSFAKSAVRNSDMPNNLIIGIVIADEGEYAPILPYVEKNGGCEHPLGGYTGHKFTIGDMEFRALLCGVGKANASAATAYLIADGADVIANIGLSGGINNVCRGELIVGTEFTEHDFDLTVFGYGVSEKPGEGSVKYGSEYLNSLFTSTYSEIKSGKFVSGDMFISEEKIRDRLRDEYKATACDMESAAIAYITAIAKIPFVSLRRISDDAGENATGVYREMYHLRESNLVDVLLEICVKIEREKL